MTHFLITGGTGLIGRALVGELTRAGHRVTVLTRDPQNARHRLPEGATAHPWDAHTLQGWAHLVEEAGAIVNLAGESIAGETLPAILTRRWSAAYKARIRESRVRIGHLLTEAIRQASRRPAVLVQASAVGYYGNTGAREVDESAPPGEDFLAEVCRAWEASTAEVESLGVRRVVIRTGLVLAREGGILPLMLLPVRMFLGGPLGSGRQAVPWIHLADEVAAIRFLLENEAARGPY
ncbi:MAG: TIGR01777 family protein, partial [Anaerolineae bacterium]